MKFLFPITINANIHIFTHNDETLRAIQQLRGEIMDQLAELQQAVSDMSGTVNSAVELINGLADKIDELKTDPEALAALASELRGKRDELANAVANNPVPE